MAGEFDNGRYCDFNSTASNAVAGKDILLEIFNETGDKLLAIAGQQGLTINRSADQIEVSSKDTVGGWKSSIAGMKEWSIDNDGLYVGSDETHRLLSKAFNNSDPVCVKVVNVKTGQDLFGGLAYVTDYPIEAPFDDAMTYSISLSGNGPLVDLTIEAETPLTEVTISGTAKVGEALTAVLDPASATATFIWKQADTADGTYTEIANATESNFTPTSSELGNFIKVQAMGTGLYSGTVLSPATEAVAASV